MEVPQEFRRTVIQQFARDIGKINYNSSLFPDERNEANADKQPAKPDAVTQVTVSAELQKPTLRVARGDNDCHSERGEESVVWFPASLLQPNSGMRPTNAFPMAID